MQSPDRVYFSNLGADPDFESLFEYDDLYDFDGDSNHFQDDADFDDADEFSWDSD